MSLNKSSIESRLVGPLRSGLGLAVLRIFTGIVIAAHGWQKIFVMGISGITEGFGQMGIPLAAVIAPLVCVMEFAGGIALILGLFPRIIAAVLTVIMLAATFLVHFKAGFFLPNGYEFTLLLAANFMTIVLAGPGAFALGSKNSN